MMNNMQKYKTGILLLNWNNEDNILRLMKELTGWKNPYSIVIVDNASENDISGLIDQSSGNIITFRSQVNRGFSGGNNLGFEYLIDNGYEFVLLLNHDAGIIEEGTDTLREGIIKNPGIGAIGPCLKEDTKTYAGGRNIARYPATRIPWDPSAPLIREVDYLPGAACILRVSALKQTGLFDERFFFSGEMADLCTRMKKAGYSCVVHTGVCITHDTGQDTPMRERIHLYYSLRNRFLYIRKHEPHTWYWMLFWVIFGFIHASGACIRKKPHSARAALLGVIDGVTGRYGDHNEYFIS
jgi:GT2 family glycosyltransferase